MSKIYPKVAVPPKPKPLPEVQSYEGIRPGRVFGVLTAMFIYASGLLLFFTKVLNAPPQDHMVIMLIGATIPLLFSMPLLFK